MSRLSGNLYAPLQTASYRAQGNVRRDGPVSGVKAQSRLGGQSIQIARPAISQQQQLSDLGRQSLSFYEEQMAARRAAAQQAAQQQTQQQLPTGFSLNNGRWTAEDGTQRPIANIANSFGGGPSQQRLQWAQQAWDNAQQGQYEYGRKAGGVRLGMVGDGYFTTAQFPTGSHYGFRLLLGDGRKIDQGAFRTVFANPPSGTQSTGPSRFGPYAGRYQLGLM